MGRYNEEKYYKYIFKINMIANLRWVFNVQYGPNKLEGPLAV